MLTVVGRILGFGLRTLATGTCLWLGFGAMSASAAERGAAVSMVQAGVGTLPLVAAMGIGIVIAVFAVIAFLQMTTRAGGAREHGVGEEEETGEAPLTDAAEEQQGAADEEDPKSPQSR